MKKIAIFFVVLAFLFCLTREVLAGDIQIDSVTVDSRSEAFANEFTVEMLNKKSSMESLLIGKYFVRVYVGPLPDHDTGKLRSAIQVFVDEKENTDFDNEKQPVIKIWLNELFSGNEIIKKARKTADYVFEYLKGIDDRKKNSIKIPV